jgi:hypothetical protein
VLLIKKIVYVLILLTVVNFFAAILPHDATDNTLLRLKNDNNLEGYIVLSKKGETYLYSSLVRKHLIESKIEDAIIYYSYDDQLEKQPHFMNVFSDDIAKILLYPYSLIKDDEKYILDLNDYKNLLNDEWEIKKGNKTTLFLPIIESCNQFKIMIYEDFNIFLKPICNNEGSIQA